MKLSFTIAFGLIFSIVPIFAQDTLIIQENTLGQCTYDGVVLTSASSITGWTETILKKWQGYDGWLLPGSTPTTTLANLKK